MWKFLGQHFLSDDNVLENIANQCFSLRDQTWIHHCVEIWPGGWALTSYLIPEFDKKVLFEMDERLKKGLVHVADDNTSIVWGDVLKADITWYKNFLIIWNLPYYITSPIFRKFFVESQLFEWWVFLIQKEVWEKIATDARKKSYLWWLVNYYYDIEYCFTVDKSAFTPPPKVQSAVVKFTRSTTIPSVPLKSVQWFLDVVSQYTRKTLWKIFKMRHEELLVKWYVLPDNCASKRLEELSWSNMEAISSSAV